MTTFTSVVNVSFNIIPENSLDGTQHSLLDRGFQRFVQLMEAFLYVPSLDLKS
jgi:hypothetical protein